MTIIESSSVVRLFRSDRTIDDSSSGLFIRHLRSRSQFPMIKRIDKRLKRLMLA